MCGRFTLGKPQNISERFSTSNKIPSFDPSFNVTPSQTLPTITRNSPNRITMMRWGFTPSWGKEKNFSLINIRKETTKEKSYFKKILLTQRCIVPSDGFYEWRTVNLEGKDEKYPFFIYLRDRSLFGFAALYSKLKDAEKKPIYTFAILTCPPNEKVGKVHHRMPVILKRSDEDKWLDSKLDDFEKLFKLLRSYPSSSMKLHPVSKRVNSPRNDDRKLTESFKEPKAPLIF